MPATIGVTVFYDGNGDGTQDAAENYAQGISVSLSGPGAPMNGVTDINGSYTFTGVPVGDYNVLVSPVDGYTSVGDGSVSVVSDTDNLGVIFPLEADGGGGGGGGGVMTNSGIILGTAFYDNNTNQIQDSGEGVAAGVVVTATPDSGTPISATTDSFGSYSFSNLAAGSYTVTFSPPTGYTVDTPVGGSQTIDVSDGTATVDAGLLGSSAGTYTAILDYDTPWDSVDPDQTSQSLPLPNFSVTLAGQAFTTTNANFTTSPTIQFSYGEYTGVTFAIDTSTVPGYPYSSLTMNGDDSLTAIDATTMTPVQIDALAAPDAVVMSATPGAAASSVLVKFSWKSCPDADYIKIVVNGPNGGVSTSTVDIDGKKGKGSKQVQTLFPSNSNVTATIEVFNSKDKSIVKSPGKAGTVK